MPCRSLYRSRFRSSPVLDRRNAAVKRSLERRRLQIVYSGVATTIFTGKQGGRMHLHTLAGCENGKWRMENRKAGKAYLPKCIMDYRARRKADKFAGTLRAQIEDIRIKGIARSPGASLSCIYQMHDFQPGPGGYDYDYLKVSGTCSNVRKVASS